MTANEIVHGEYLLSRITNSNPYHGYKDYSDCKSVEEFFEKYKSNGAVKEAGERNTVIYTNIGKIPWNFGHELHFWYEPVVVDYEGNNFKIDIVYYFVCPGGHDSTFAVSYMRINECMLKNFTGVVFSFTAEFSGYSFVKHESLDDQDLIDFMTTERLKSNVKEKLTRFLYKTTNENDLQPESLSYFSRLKPKRKSFKL